jgi:hypothetical protein
MKPFAIVYLVTAERELKYSIFDAPNMLLRCHDNVFITSSPFELWARTVSFPTVERRREDLAYNSKALLLLDGLRSHHPPNSGRIA